MFCKSVCITLFIWLLSACDVSGQKGISQAGDAGQVTLMGAETSPYAVTGMLGKSLPDLSDALAKGQISSQQLTRAYIDRIEQLNLNGPALRAVLMINPDALQQAYESDTRQALGAGLGPLDGIPILIKDNIETSDPMPTTAGALALKDNITGRDSPLVAGLRRQGAVILGKTNLSQWANFRSESSNSGWSSLGGQVLNPHILNRNPCGSSSGSGVATAASLAAGSVGTETNGSIICPSNVNGIVGFKPTVGLVSARHIVPISPSQDTAGPMTKTVSGAAMLLSAMQAGPSDYTAHLSVESLRAKRIGVLRFAQGSDPLVIDRFNVALADLESAGAELVMLEAQPALDARFWDDAFLVLKYEFKASLNAYLAGTPASVSARTLADLIAFNQAHAEVELAAFDQSIFEASEMLGPLTSPQYREALDRVQNATRSNGIDRLRSDFDVDVLVAP